MDVNVFFAILSVLAEHGRLITGILLLMLLGQSVSWSVLKMLFGDKLSSEEYYSLSIAGWVLHILLASLLWFAWGMLQQPASGAFVLLIFLMIVALVLFLRTPKESLPGSTSIFLILIALFGIFFFLRLAFVSKALLPLYFDSAHHYLNIKNLINCGCGADLQAKAVRTPEIPCQRSRALPMDVFTRSPAKDAL